MPVEFKRATRQSVKLKLSISGPSGSGKTLGALEIAQGLGGRVALIDTENESAALYADRFVFDHLCMHQPFIVDKFKAAIDAAVAAKYDVLIVDSASHEWAAEGGILDQKTQIDLRGTKDSKNQFANWAKPSAEHNRFIAAIVQAPIHIIATVRSKVEYDLSEGKPKKLGLAPVQRDGWDYEFSVVFDLAMNHDAVASKDRTSLFDQKHFKLSPAIGKELRAWLEHSPRPAEGAGQESGAGVAGTGVSSLPVPTAEPSASEFARPEFDDDSEEQKQHVREAMFKLATFQSGPMAGQFVEAAPVAFIEKALRDMEKAGGGNALYAGALRWWLDVKADAEWKGVK